MSSKVIYLVRILSSAGIVRGIVPFLLSVTVAVTSSAKADELDRLIDVWRKGDYKRAATELLVFREKPYGKNVVVDYMIATSLCRISDRRQLGRKFLYRILSVYDVNDAGRAQLRKEQDLCRTEESIANEGVGVVSAPAPAPRSLVHADVAEFDVGVSGKTFYRAGRYDDPIYGEKIRVINKSLAEDLQSRRFRVGDLDAAAERTRAVIGPESRVVTGKGFVVAAADKHSLKALRSLVDLLHRTKIFFHQEFSIPLPQYVTTVYLSTPPEFKRMAERVHGLDIPRQNIGYSVADDFSVAAAMGRIEDATLKHELFHLMVRHHFGDVPPWLDEGVAALFEVSRWNGDRLFGLRNWRDHILRQSGPVELDELVSMNWREFDASSPARRAANHATARYFALFLQRRRRLQTVYHAFRRQKVEQLSGDRRVDAVALLETALGSSIKETRRDFESWLESLEKVGSSRALARAQQRLNTLGIDAGPVDGRLGSKTKRAIAAFQQLEQLKATGTLTVVTADLLKLRASSATP